MKQRLFFISALAALFSDQLIKFIVLKFSPQIVSFNRGIVFGFLASDLWLGVNLFLLILIWFLAEKSLGWSLLFGGGMSNFIDRVFKKGVVDFLSFNFTFFPKPISLPHFNPADVFICVGAGLLFWRLLRQKKVYKLKTSSNKKQPLHSIK